MDMKYEEVARGHMIGKYSVGVKILVSTDHAVTEEEGRILDKMVDEVKRTFLRESVRRNPEEAARAKTERDDLLSVFDDPIYVEEIPNGYCHDWCCCLRPWFVVTTRKGKITIGWRKRVVQIEWDSNVAGLAEKLFPSETSTKFDRTIHAWSLADARRYVGVLMREGQRADPDAYCQHCDAWHGQRCPNAPDPRPQKTSF